VTVLVVVQARMGSTRLPGKVLQDLVGRPMLQLQLDRLRHGIPADWTIAVATSTDAIDDPVAKLAASADVAVVRGSERDVLDRFAVALDEIPSRTVVRLTGDCPLTDPQLVADVVALHERSGVAYTSNVYPRSYPRGLDVEVMTSDALKVAADEASDPVEREHVTPFLVRRPRRFPMATLFSGDDLGEEHWTVDRPEDLERVRVIADRLSDPVTADWRTILAVAGPTAVPRGAVHLRPLPPPAPGSCPWIRSWIAVRDGTQLGRVDVAVSDATEIAIDAAGDDRAEVERALDALLAHDVQVSRSDPT